MSKAPIKFSGMIAAGRLHIDDKVPASDTFARRLPQEKSDAPQEDAAAQQTPSTYPLGVEIMLPLALLDDSPYQFRRKYEVEHIDGLSQSLEANGQREPITVRRVKQGRFQIIKGHCRPRAARNIDWKEIKAIILERTDDEARVDSMLSNEQGKLDEYSYAHMFQAALTNKDAKTQAGVAAMFGCSQAKVSNCLAMLKLPRPVLDLLDKDSALLGADAAKAVLDLWDKLPDDQAIIVEAVERVAQGAEQKSIKAWVSQKVAQKSTKSAVSSVAARGPAPRHVIPSAKGLTRYVTQAKGRDIVVRLSDPDIDPKIVHKAIDDLLRELEKQKGEIEKPN